MNRTYFLTCLTLTAGLLNANQSLACASCGLNLKSDWEGSGVAMSNGFKYDIRYDYIDQDQLRHGSSTIAPAAAAFIANKQNHPYEIEKFTKNQYITFSTDYSAPSGWGVNIALPYIIRSHETLGTGSDGANPAAGGGAYRFSNAEFGDLRILGRFAGFESSNIGLLFGVKLPTGAHMKKGISTDPAAPGQVFIGRGLQPGTGTTDGILGLNYSMRPSKQLAYTINAMYQHALDVSDHYRPGDNYTVNAGLRYMLNDWLTPQLQINYRGNNRSTGSNADVLDTAAQIIYLSPGFSLHVNDQATFYSLLQLPVYQQVEDAQVVAKMIGSAGVHFAF